jgi:ABC-type Zn uptake system ZnuABC Zn-binding protein ZnuA
MFDPRFMDKLMSNEANKNEEIEKRRKKKRLIKGSSNLGHKPIIFNNHHIWKCVL